MVSVNAASWGGHACRAAGDGGHGHGNSLRWPGSVHVQGWGRAQAFSHEALRPMRVQRASPEILTVFCRG
jgi:hypothetical protein